MRYAAAWLILFALATRGVAALTGDCWRAVRHVLERRRLQRDERLPPWIKDAVACSSPREGRRAIRAEWAHQKALKRDLAALGYIDPAEIPALFDNPKKG